MAQSNDGWEDVPSTTAKTANDGWEDVPSANDTITDRVQSSPMSKEELDKFLLDNPDLAGYDTYKKDPNAGRSANPTGVQPVSPTLGFESSLPGEYSLKYDDVRKGLASLTAPFIGAWNTMTGPKGNIGNPDQIPYTQAVGESYNKAMEGKGIPGLVSDPINLTMFIPGVGEVTAARLAGMGGKAAKAGEYLASHPTILKGAGSAIEGAGYTGASEALDPTKEFRGRDMVIGGGIGGALGTGAGFLKQWGKESFPGVMTGNARSIDAPAKERLAAELDEILSQGMFPKNRRGFEQISDRETAKLGKEYSRGIQEATPFSFYDEGAKLPTIEGEHGFMVPSKNMQTPTTAYHVSGIRNDYTLPKQEIGIDELGEIGYVPHTDEHGMDVIGATNIPMLTPLNEIEQSVRNIYQKKLADADILSNKNMKIFDKQLEATKESKVVRDNMDAVIDDIFGQNISKEEREAIREKFRENPIYEAKELSNLRNNRNDPNMYKDLSKSGEVQHANRLLATTWRDVINDRLGMDPRYSAYVTPQVKARYGLYKSLGDVVDAPGSTRLSDRIFGLTVDPWMRASTIYKAGGLVDKLRKLTPTASSNVDQ